MSAGGIVGGYVSSEVSTGVRCPVYLREQGCFVLVVQCPIAIRAALGFGTREGRPVAVGSPLVVAVYDIFPLVRGVALRGAEGNGVS